MLTDPTAPATKQDIALLMETISALYEAITAMRTRIDGVDNRFIAMEKTMKDWKDEIIRHFDVVTETLDRDLRGAFRDHTSVNTNRFGVHDKRIARLERHTGLVSR